MSSEGLRELRDEYAGLSLPLGSTREAAEHERLTGLMYIDRILALAAQPAAGEDGVAEWPCRCGHVLRAHELRGCRSCRCQSFRQARAALQPASEENR